MTVKEGEPYFCSQCGRNHVKGKIYKDHFKYAQEDGPKEAVEEVDKLNDEIDEDIELDAEEIAKQGGIKLAAPETTILHNGLEIATKGEFIYRAEYLGRTVRQVVYVYDKG